MTPPGIRTYVPEISPHRTRTTGGIIPVRCHCLQGPRHLLNMWRTPSVYAHTRTKNKKRGNSSFCQSQESLGTKEGKMSSTPQAEVPPFVGQFRVDKVPHLAQRLNLSKVSEVPQRYPSCRGAYTFQPRQEVTRWGTPLVTMSTPIHLVKGYHAVVPPSSLCPPLQSVKGYHTDVPHLPQFLHFSTPSREVCQLDSSLKQTATVRNCQGRCTN